MPQSFNGSGLGRPHPVFPFGSMVKAAVRTNDNIRCQMSWEATIDPSSPVTSYKIAGAVRNGIAPRLDIGPFQKVLNPQQEPCLGNFHACMADAACHESPMRFPTGMKLLWESAGWLHWHTCRRCRVLGARRPHNKYTDVPASCLSCCKERKRKDSRARMPKCRMPRLLEKLPMQRDGIHREHGAPLRCARDYQKRLSIVRKVLVQEKEMFEGRKAGGRIASIGRHYIRPAVRGKGAKPVEPSAKANNIQADGISFTGYIPSKAFNEGMRLKGCIRVQRKLMGVRVRCVAAGHIC